MIGNRQTPLGDPVWNFCCFGEIYSLLFHMSVYPRFLHPLHLYVKQGYLCKVPYSTDPSSCLKTSCYYIKPILLQGCKSAWLEGIIFPGFMSSLFHLLSVSLSARAMLLSHSLLNTKGYQPPSEQPTPFPNHAQKHRLETCHLLDALFKCVT